MFLERGAGPGRGCCERGLPRQHGHGRGGHHSGHAGTSAGPRALARSHQWPPEQGECRAAAHTGVEASSLLPLPVGCCGSSACPCSSPRPHGLATLLVLPSFLQFTCWGKLVVLAGIPHQQGFWMHFRIPGLEAGLGSAGPASWRPPGGALCLSSSAVVAGGLLGDRVPPGAGGDFGPAS